MRRLTVLHRHFSFLCECYLEAETAPERIWFLREMSNLQLEMSRDAAADAPFLQEMGAVGDLPLPEVDPRRQ